MVFRNVHQLTELTDVEWVNMTERSIVHFNREESVPDFKKTGGKVYFPVFAVICLLHINCRKGLVLAESTCAQRLLGSLAMHTENNSKNRSKDPRERKTFV